MKRTSRLRNIRNQRADLWNDSDTASTSTTTAGRVRRSFTDSDSSNDENSQRSPARSCCLICSILPKLSDVNTCPKHLASLIAPTQVVYMMQPPMDHCHCRSRSKRRRRSRSGSSSSSDQSRHPRKKRLLTIETSESSSEEDLFYSPTGPSQQPHTSAVHNSTSRTPSGCSSQDRLSPSLPPSLSIASNMNESLRKCQQLALTSFLQRANQRNNEDTSSVLTEMQNRPMSEANSSEVLDLSSLSACSSPVSNQPIIHVKDEAETYADSNLKLGSINMSQVTEEMQNHEYPQPTIFLKRVRLEQYDMLDESL